MNKGCIIALCVGVALFLIVGAVGGFLVYKNKDTIAQFGEATLLFAVEESGKNYLKANPDSVPATNEEWATALKGTDYDTITVNGQTKTMEIDSMIQNGKFMSIMGGGEVVITAVDGEVTAVLPGKDGEVGTADDITSASFKKLLQK